MGKLPVNEESMNGKAAEVCNGDLFSKLLPYLLNCLTE